MEYKQHKVISELIRDKLLSEEQREAIKALHRAFFDAQRENAYLRLSVVEMQNDLFGLDSQPACESPQAPDPQIIRASTTRTSSQTLQENHIKFDLSGSVVSKQYAAVPLQQAQAELPDSAVAAGDPSELNKLYEEITKNAQEYRYKAIELRENNQKILAERDYYRSEVEESRAYTESYTKKMTLAEDEIYKLKEQLLMTESFNTKNQLDDEEPALQQLGFQ